MMITMTMQTDVIRGTTGGISTRAEISMMAEEINTIIRARGLNIGKRTHTRMKNLTVPDMTKRSIIIGTKNSLLS